jgi:hypothetical protein
MTQTEKDTYNYWHYMAKQDPEQYKDADKKYLAEIQEILNARVGKQYYEAMKGKTVVQTVFGLQSGLNQAYQGFSQLGNNVFGDGEAVPTSPIGYASGNIRNDMEKGSLQSIIYDTLSGVGNMLPSVAIGTLTAGGGGAAALAASAYGNT